MEAYAIISIQTASPALDFQCLVFLTDELKTQLLHTILEFLFLYKFIIDFTIPTPSAQRRRNFAGHAV